MKVRSVFVSVLCCVTLLSGCRQDAKQQEEGGNYPLMTLKPEDRQLSVKYSAVIKGKQDVEVRPQVSGTITQVCVELEGKQSLFADKVISEFELRTAQNDYKSVKAALLQAQAELTEARNNLSYTEVKSPVDGYAGMTSYRIGALGSPSMTDALISVSDNSEMYAYFSLTEKQVLSLTVQYGSLDQALQSFPEVSLELNDGSAYEQKGKIDVISGIIDKTTGTVSMRAVFNNKDKRLMSGGQANIIIPYDRPQSIVVPQEATYEIQNRIFAYKVVDNKAVSTPITVFEINDGTEYIVEEGLQDGDVIVSEGAGLLKDGSTVATTKEGKGE